MLLIVLCGVLQVPGGDLAQHTCVLGQLFPTSQDFHHFLTILCAIPCGFVWVKIWIDLPKHVCLGEEMVFQ